MPYDIIFEDFKRVNERIKYSVKDHSGEWMTSSRIIN